MKHKKKPFHKKTVPQKAQVTGKLKGHPEGYGFVISEKSGDPDIYIRKDNMGDAMHGDRVAVAVMSVRKGGKTEGQIIKVLERAYTQMIGQLRGGQVISSNKRIVQALSIPIEKIGSAKEGDIVSATILRYPTSKDASDASDASFLGAIQKVLGRLEDPHIDTLLVAESYALSPDFTMLSDQEADDIPQQVTAKHREGRVDLRSLPTVTIDEKRRATLMMRSQLKRKQADFGCGFILPM